MRSKRLIYWKFVPPVAAVHEFVLCSNALANVEIIHTRTRPKSSSGTVAHSLLRLEFDQAVDSDLVAFINYLIHAAATRFRCNLLAHDCAGRFHEVYT